jgi:immune inhibitor A
MRRGLVALVACAAVFVLTIGASMSIAAGGGPQGRSYVDDRPSGRHDLDGPKSQEQRELRAKAVEMKLKGKAAAGAKKVRVGQQRKWVELAREDTDKIFVVITEFGNTRHPSYPDTLPDGTPASDALVFDGPLHNKIPQPNRKVDNSTLWQADYSKSHYENMYFSRMAKYYQAQSSGRYSVNGAVTEWVKVPFNEARYGRDFCGDIVCTNTWLLVRDALAYYVDSQLAAGKTLAEISDYLKTFDEWDRYDLDGDGNFDEADGFIDHFQIVHSGGDQAAGDPQQGSDAIWSHRWYAQVSVGGPGGLPGVNAGQGGASGGVNIPNNPTGVWVGDYTIQPENGGLGVFAHEFGHDLGLPDLYDTSGNTGGAENSTGFWTLMSSGANIGSGGKNGIGDAPTDMGAWEKFQLGWLGTPSAPGGSFYDVAFAGETSEHRLGPAEGAISNGKQALFVVLPDKEVISTLGAPYDGSDFYYSGSGDDLNNVMAKQVTLSATPTFAAQARYEIELDWDYAYAVVSTDGGATWIPLATNLSTSTDPNGQNHGNGITGEAANWTTLTADVAAYAGQTVLLGFQYFTDGAVAESGFQVDGITIDGAADSGGWTFTPADGFRVTTGSETELFFNAYVGEYRVYTSYDKSLKTAYNFGFANTKPDYVETFAYQDGLLISYWDESQSGNNVGDNPGSGLILPIDSHPTFHHYYDGQLLRARVLTYDSPFSNQPTRSIKIHKDGQPTTIPSSPGVGTFDDTKDWWFNSDEHAATGSHVGRYQPGWVGVNPPKTGTTISVLGGNGPTIKVKVAPK